MLAASAGNVEMVQLLLHLGANPILENKVSLSNSPVFLRSCCRLTSSQSQDGETASGLAWKNKHQEVVHVLQKWITERKRESLSTSGSFSHSLLSLWNKRKGSADSLEREKKGDSKDLLVPARSCTPPPENATASAPFSPPTSITTISGPTQQASQPISIAPSSPVAFSSWHSSSPSSPSPRTTPESSLIVEEDERQPEQQEDSHVIDGSRITITHEELNAIRDQTKQLFLAKERELIARQEREVQRMVQGWHKKLERKKRKKRDIQERIRVLSEQVATLQNRNTDLRNQVDQLEKQQRTWSIYVGFTVSCCPHGVAFEY